MESAVLITVVEQPMASTCDTQPDEGSCQRGILDIEMGTVRQPATHPPDATEAGGVDSTPFESGKAAETDKALLKEADADSSKGWGRFRVVALLILAAKRFQGMQQRCNGVHTVGLGACA